MPVNSSRNATDNKKLRPANRNNKSIYIGLFTFLILFIYLTGYIVNYWFNRSDIQVEIAKFGHIDVPKVQTGVIVRDEYVVSGSAGGTVTYYHLEGEKVMNNAKICGIISSDAPTDIEARINQYDENIFKQQMARLSISSFAGEFKMYNDRIKQTVDSYISRFLSVDTTEVLNLSAKIKKEVDVRNEMLFQTDTESLNGLADERNVALEMLSQNTYIINAPYGGILSYYIDGHEKDFVPQAVAEVTKEQTKVLGDRDVKFQTKVVKSGDELFKVIASNTWYLVSYINDPIAESWEEGDTREIFIRADKENRRILMQVEHIEPLDKEMFVVLKSDRYLIDFLEKRHLEFELTNISNDGIKIPNNAIIEKVLLKIPNDYIVEYEGKKGIIKKGELTQDFVEIPITGGDDDYVYTPQDFESLKLDDIIIKNERGQASQFRISEIQTSVGVFVANSNSAEFKQITVLASNSEYSVIESKTTYGVQLYDRIVSDASSVKENQRLDTR